MNKTAKLIQRVLMAIASLLNALLPILHVSKYEIRTEFIVGVNLVCSVLLALACKPIAELNSELVESVNNLANVVSTQNSSRIENHPFNVPVEVGIDVPIPSPQSQTNEPTQDSNIVVMNAYYNVDTCDVSITPRL